MVGCIEIYSLVAKMWGAVGCTQLNFWSSEMEGFTTKECCRRQWNVKWRRLISINKTSAHSLISALFISQEVGKLVAVIGDEVSNAVVVLPFGFYHGRHCRLSRNLAVTYWRWCHKDSFLYENVCRRRESRWRFLNTFIGTPIQFLL